ncbi:MAG: winged helix-turn-helix transcriptional regulator [Rubrivivax sp.]|nr:winged helix-turn-helix transcriptional regulator [Rubrivivax sp.]
MRPPEPPRATSGSPSHAATPGETARAGPEPPTDALAAPGAEAAQRVLRRFRLVFNAVKTHFQQVERQAGIGGAQLWALSVVRAQPGIGVGALGRSMDVHQTTASNLVRSLVSQGLVESHRSGIDKRASQLKITRHGLRLLARAPGPFSGVLPDALARLDPSVLDRLDADLARLLEMLETDKRAARIPLAQM